MQAEKLALPTRAGEKSMTLYRWIDPLDRGRFSLEEALERVEIIRRLEIDGRIPDRSAMRLSEAIIFVLDGLRPYFDRSDVLEKSIFLFAVNGWLVSNSTKSRWLINLSSESPYMNPLCSIEKDEIEGSRSFSVLNGLLQPYGLGISKKRCKVREGGRLAQELNVGLGHVPAPPPIKHEYLNNQHHHVDEIIRLNYPFLDTVLPEYIDGSFQEARG